MVAPNRRLVLTGLVTLIVVSITVAVPLFAVRGRGEGPVRTGIPLSAEDQALIADAAQTCPALTPARLAGQVMANSGFDPSSTFRPGRTGLAGLTDAQWQRWAPGPSADRTARGDQITALAHLMCDLVGRLQSVSSTVDEWRLALAAFLVGTEQVTRSGDVPAGEAAEYVAAVVAYADWYGDHAFPSPAVPVLGEVPSSPPPPKAATTAPTPTTSGSPLEVWDAYARIEAEHYAAEHGTVIEDCRDTGGGANVGRLAPGDWLRYDRLDFGATPATRITLRYAGDLPAGMTGTVEVRLDSLQAPLIGVVTVVSTGGWQTWTTVRADLAPTTGVHDVYLAIASSNGWEIGNINWLTFGR